MVARLWKGGPSKRITINSSHGHTTIDSIPLPPILSFKKKYTQYSWTTSCVPMFNQQPANTTGIDIVILLGFPPLPRGSKNRQLGLIFVDCAQALSRPAASDRESGSQADGLRPRQVHPRPPQRALRAFADGAGSRRARWRSRSGSRRAGRRGDFRVPVTLLLLQDVRRQLSLKPRRHSRAACEVLRTNFGGARARTRRTHLAKLWFVRKNNAIRVI
jgi:hypothetical protein